MVIAILYQSGANWLTYPQIVTGTTADDKPEHVADTTRRAARMLVDRMGKSPALLWRTCIPEEVARDCGPRHALRALAEPHHGGTGCNLLQLWAAILPEGDAARPRATRSVPAHGRYAGTVQCADRPMRSPSPARAGRGGE